MISGDYASSSSEGDEPEVEVEQETAQLDNDSSDISSALSSPPLPDSTVAFDETELLEYEIIVDGEVVGTTHMTPAAARVAMPGSLPLNNNAPTAARTIGSTATSRPCAPSECATCSATAPRYRCPGCSTMSCSLACVSTHKQQSGCTGKRPRSTYVPLHSFTANQLQHDLFFLEEVARNTHNTKRHPLLPHGSSHRNTHGRGGGGAEGEDEDGQAEGVGAFTVRDVSGRYVALQRACVRLGIKLMVMPTGMRRHSINSSVWNAREGRLCWHVEWLLDSDKVSMHQSHVDGSSTWREALVNLLTQRDRSTQRRERRKAHRSQHNPHGGEQQADEERKEAEEEKEGTETVTAVSGGDSQRVVAHHSDPKMRHQLQQYADALDSLTLHLRVPMTAVGYIAHKTVSSCLPHAPVRLRADTHLNSLSLTMVVVCHSARKRITMHYHCHLKSTRR